MEIDIPQRKVKHLMNRASFGLGLLFPLGDTKQVYETAEKIIPLEAVQKPSLDQSSIQTQRNDSSRKEAMKGLFEKSRQGLMKINVAWMEKMCAHPSLHERMTFFWHGHFACRTLVPYFA